MIAWLEARLREILAAPQMWGSPEAVEMQVLLLLEVFAVASGHTQDPRLVLRTYEGLLRAKFPAGVGPLWQRVGANEHGALFITTLRDVSETILAMLRKGGA